MRNKTIKGVNWCVIDARRHVMKCKRCGEEIPDGLPMDFRKAIDRIDGFMHMHKNCKP